jgi:hypothetical protein
LLTEVELLQGGAQPPGRSPRTGFNSTYSQHGSKGDVSPS